MARKPFDPLSSSVIDLDPLVGTRPLSVEEAEARAARNAANTQVADMAVSGPQPRPGTAAWNAQGATIGMSAMPYQSDDEEAIRAEFVRRFGREPQSQEEISFMRAQLADERAAKLDSDLSANGYGARRVPGARTLDGSRPAQGAPFTSLEDAQNYHVRPRGEDGRIHASEADADMHARGLVPVNTPDGIAYTVAAVPAEGVAADGAAGRLGYRPDLLEAGYEEASVMGPTGMQRVYRPIRSEGGSVDAPGKSAGAGDKLDRYRNRQLKARLGGAAGIDGDVAEATVAGGGMDALRQKAANAREADLNDRRAAYVRRSQAMQNPLEYIGRDDIDEWQRMIAADRMLRGGFTGPTPLGVQAMNAANAGRMAQQAMTAFLTNNPQAGVAAQAAQQQANAARTTQRQEAVQWAEDHVGSNYANDQGVGNWLTRQAIGWGIPLHDPTHFSAQEQVNTVNSLLARYPTMTEQEAWQIVGDIAGRKTPDPRPQPPAEK